MNEYDVLKPIILFNKMLMEMKEEYERKECPLKRWCPFWDDECYENYVVCPVYWRCRNEYNVIKCIREQGWEVLGWDVIMWRNIYDVLGEFIRVNME